MLMLYYYEKLNMTGELCKLMVHIENEPEAIYYYEFFFYTFLRIKIEDILNFFAEV